MFEKKKKKLKQKKNKKVNKNKKIDKRKGGKQKTRRN